MRRRRARVQRHAKSMTIRRKPVGSDKDPPVRLASTHACTRSKKKIWLPVPIQRKVIWQDRTGRTHGRAISVGSQDHVLRLRPKGLGAVQRATPADQPEPGIVLAAW